MTFPQQLPAEPYAAPLATRTYTNQWRWNNQAPPPISGQVRTDTRDWATATHVLISNVTDGVVDVSVSLISIVVGTNLDIAHATDATRSARYTVRSVAAGAGFTDVGVTFVSAAGTLPNSGTVCAITMVLPAATVAWTIAEGPRGTWRASTWCPHGTASVTTYVNGEATAPDCVALWDASVRNHQTMLACGCPPGLPTKAADVTFQVPGGVPPRQQRYVVQTGGTTYTPNFFFGPGLTCQRAGAYSITAKVQLGKTLAQGAGGLGVIVIQGVPVLSAPIVDEGGKATANVAGVVNLTPNQSVNLGYDNTSKNMQDVVLATLSVLDLWVP